MTEEQKIEQLRAQFLGKRVRVKNYKARDGRVSDWVGTCQFFGHNPNFPSFGIQITIDRTPLTNISLDQVSLEVDRTLRVVKQ